MTSTEPDPRWGESSPMHAPCVLADFQAGDCCVSFYFHIMNMTDKAIFKPGKFVRQGMLAVIVN